MLGEVGLHSKTKILLFRLFERVAGLLISVTGKHLSNASVSQLPVPHIDALHVVVVNQILVYAVHRRDGHHIIPGLLYQIV